MPALAFGLKPGKAQPKFAAPPAKRKAVFGDDEVEDEDDSAFSAIAKPAAKTSKLKLKPILDDGDEGSQESPHKSPKLSTGSSPRNGDATTTRYSNLSALRTAKLHDEQASKVDASVYDYDAVYETFHAKPKAKSAEESTGPKYMTSLVASADIRKRDQLRAREKQLQKERENEGDEFADKEKFVTGAYKKAQEETRRIEEEEKKREQEEDERRKKGGGMEAFNRGLLQKEEERQKMIALATAEAQQRKERGEHEDTTQPEDDDENGVARELNEKGARIALNDEGEVLDKRQLLGAGLNITAKKQAEIARTKSQPKSDQTQEWHRSSKAQDARASQRERQTRMIEQQIEEMARKQEESEAAERKEAEEKNKSKVSDDAKMGAKERFLQRKKEREEEAKKKAAGK